jgi:RNA polymerase sigma-70 factor (ECF subfamily)
LDRSSLVRSADTEDDPLDVHQAESLEAHHADLVAQIVNGNIEGPMRELYQRYAGSIYRLGIQLLGDGGLAEEVVQHSFERLWRGAARFDSQRGTVGAYLTVIARSIARDIAKRPSSRPFLPLDENLVQPQGDSVDEILDTLILRQALDTLPEAQRDVLRLALEGFTQSQIALRMDLPLGTVKTRTFHGMKALRTVLAERGIHAA